MIQTSDHTVTTVTISIEGLLTDKSNVQLTRATDPR